MTNLTSRLAALGLGALLLTTACGDDTILEPTLGAGCAVGTLGAGQTVTGSLNSSSCRLTYHFYTEDVMPYESWQVHLEAGKAYMFYLQQAPDPAQEDLNEIDAVMTLYGKDDQGHSVPLAVSDDDGGGVDGLDSEFWFIAPRSGDFVLLAGSYGWEAFGGYRLTMQSCPVLGTLDTTGTYTFPAPISTCIRHNHDDYNNTPIAYAFLRAPADSFETISASIGHPSSNVAIEMGGPEFDTYANIYDESDNTYGSCCWNSVTMDEIPGIVTIALGTATFNAAGDYEVEFERTPATAPSPATRTFDGRMTLKSTFAHPKKAR